MKNYITAAIGVAALALMPNIALADKIKMTAASSHPDFLPWVSVIKNHVVPESNKRLKEAGVDLEIAWTEAYAGSMFDAASALESVEGGLADLAWIGTIFEPAKMPLQNIHFYAPFVADDVHLLAKIGNLLHDTVPAMNEQWAKYNQHFLGAMADGSYQIISNQPINTLEDLNGLKLMAGGAVGNWLEGTGAVPIAGAFPDFYNNISTGIADGAVVTVNGMFPFKLYEVAQYITIVNLGGPITGALSMNKDTWEALPPEAQQIFADLGREYTTMVTDAVADREATFLQKMIDNGAEVSVLSDVERKRWADSLPDLAGDWVKRNEALGLPAAEVLSAFLEAAKAGGKVPVRDWAGE